MNRIHVSALVLLLVISSLLYAMHTPHKATSGSATVNVSGLTNIDNNHIQEALINKMRFVPAGGYIGIDTPYLTDPVMVELLLEVLGYDVNVVINLTGVDDKFRIKDSDLEDLENAGAEIYRIAGLHTKRIIIADVDPRGVQEKDLNSLKHVSVFLGSYNLSEQAQHNIEFMTFVKDDLLYFLDNYNDHNAIQQLAESEYSCADDRPARESSPQRIQAFPSRMYDLSKTKQNSINRMAQGNNRSDDMLDITSMTFNDQGIIKSIQHLISKNRNLKIRLFVEKQQLTEPWQYKILNDLDKEGVRVYTFMKDQLGNDTGIMHVKTILRRKDGKESVIVSTGNLTSQGNNKEINMDAYHPNDHALFVKVKAINDYLAAKGTLYKPAVSSSSSSSSGHKRGRK